MTPPFFSLVVCFVVFLLSFDIFSWSFPLLPSNKTERGKKVQRFFSLSSVVFLLSCFFSDKINVIFFVTFFSLFFLFKILFPLCLLVSFSFFNLFVASSFKELQQKKTSRLPFFLFLFTTPIGEMLVQ